MADRPKDITSPITDHIQPLKTSADDVRRAGRVPYDKPTAAQQANEFDMGGHAARAKDLLRQASEEMKLAALAANRK